MSKELETLRNNARKYDTQHLQFARRKFLDWFVPINDWNEIQVFEMYPVSNGVAQTEKITPQYLKDYFRANTRTKSKAETRAECDKLPIELSISFFADICLELIKKKIHFAVFYAEGQRSPHIIIYDFEELRTLRPFAREKAQAQFWRNVIPFRNHLLDHSIFSDEHYLPLEFAPHWKYGTPFDLLFEYVPEVKTCND